MKRLLYILFVYGVVAVGFFVGHSAWGALLGFHAAMLCVLWLERHNLPPLSTLVKSEQRRWLILSLLLSSTSGLGLYILWPWLGISPNLSTQLQALGLTLSTWPAFIVYFTLVNPWLEEYFWRASLASSSKYLQPIDFAFAGYHSIILAGRTSLATLMLALAVLITGSWFWRQLSRKDSGFLAAALGHMLADLTILLAVYRMVA